MMEPPVNPQQSAPFWTKTTIALVLINVIFLAVIAIGLWLVFGVYGTALTAWLEDVFGV